MINSMQLPTGIVCRAWITIKGVRYYARDYGKKAFCFFPSGEEQYANLAKIMEIKKATPIKK